MLRETDEVLATLYLIRDMVWPQIEAADKRGEVDLDHIYHSCGTPSCVLGHCEAVLGNRRVLETRLALGRHQPKLFGSSAFGTLADRRRALDRLIAEREEMLV